MRSGGELKGKKRYTERGVEGCGGDTQLPGDNYTEGQLPFKTIAPYRAIDPLS